MCLPGIESLRMNEHEGNIRNTIAILGSDQNENIRKFKISLNPPPVQKIGRQGLCRTLAARLAEDADGFLRRNVAKCGLTIMFSRRKRASIGFDEKRVSSSSERQVLAAGVLHERCKIIIAY